jgi:hypothetical protein
MRVEEGQMGGDARRKKLRRSAGNICKPREFKVRPVGDFSSGAAAAGTFGVCFFVDSGPLQTVQSDARSGQDRALQVLATEMLTQGAGTTESTEYGERNRNLLLCGTAKWNLVELVELRGFLGVTRWNGTGSSGDKTD